MKRASELHPGDFIFMGDIPITVIHVSRPRIRSGPCDHEREKIIDVTWIWIGEQQLKSAGFFENELFHTVK